MGVPKFYRWLSERYPLINQAVTLDSKPIIDCLYLDMNGIIHQATHGEGIDPFSAYDEEQTMGKVFRYIDFIVSLAKPRIMLYLALDGCAPRAKMNQQRSRRFRSAREAADAKEAAIREGKITKDFTLFDSNCITPGTSFMHNLTRHLRFFIQKKIHEDAAWRSLKVLYSGHEVPGEGEHKIMEYARVMKMQEEYSPNLRHCIGGLDADLIFLSLVLHEPHTFLLREEVSFGQRRDQIKETFVEDKNFQLLHISLLREYFYIEFCRNISEFQVDLERVIDDFVLICILVGNDFVPHIPSLDIGEGGLDELIEIYKEELVLHGYLTENGKISFSNLTFIMQRLAERERDVFIERAKRANKGRRRNRSPKPSKERKDLDESIAILSGNNVKYVKDYYNEKQWVISVSDESPEVTVEDICHAYLEGIAWVYEYYYCGVPSWSWFYPYLYGPLASSLTAMETPMESFVGDFSDRRGTPFRPLQQLLAVLPAESAHLLPRPFWDLMRSPSSPLFPYYPSEFETDLNGKRNDWEAVVLIPFIDEDVLLPASRAIEETLTSPEHKSLNAIGCDTLFYWSEKESSVSNSISSSIPSLFSSIERSCVEQIDFSLPSNEVEFVPNIPRDVRIPGDSFPFLHGISVRGKLSSASPVNVFGFASRKESLLIDVCSPTESMEEEEAVHPFYSLPRVQREPELELEELARVLTTKVQPRLIFVDWPYWRPALVDAVSVGSQIIELGDGASPKVQEIASAVFDGYRKKLKQLITDFKVKRGVKILYSYTDTIVLHVRCVTGTQRSHTVSNGTDFCFESERRLFPLSLCALKEITTNAELRDSRYLLAEGVLSPKSLFFPVGSVDVLILPRPGKSPEAKKNIQFFGCVAVVTKVDFKRKKVKVRVTEPSLRLTTEDPGFSAAIVKKYGSMRTMDSSLKRIKYTNSYKLAKKLGISTQTLNKITSSVIANPGKVDIGLGLKFYKRDLAVPGFCKKIHSKSGGYDSWEFSTGAIEVIKEYLEKFPEIRRAIEKNPTVYTLSLDEVNKNKVRDYLASVEEWLKAQAYKSLPLVSSEAQLLPRQAIEEIEAAVTDLYSEIVVGETVSLWMSFSEVYSSMECRLSSEWSPTQKFACKLGQRVAYIGAKKSIPFGTRGAVCGR